MKQSTELKTKLRRKKYKERRNKALRAEWQKLIIPKKRKLHELPKTKIKKRKKGILEDDNEEQMQRNECIICFEKEKTFAFIPCGHKILCSECVKKKFQKCPLCRKSVTGVLRIYD